MGQCLGVPFNDPMVPDLNQITIRVMMMNEERLSILSSSTIFYCESKIDVAT